MTYVIAGVTGNTGGAAADALLAQGKNVRVVVRDEKKGQPWKARGAEVAVADLGDAQALSQALRGATGAYLLVPPTFAAPDFRAYQRRLTDAIAEALEATPVPHVVFLSSVGADLPEGTGPVAALHYAESRLRRIPGIAFQFIRAGYFIENTGGSLGMLEQGVLPTFFPQDLPIDMIAARDIGVFAARLLAEGAKSSETIDFYGPTASNVDVAATLSRIAGREIKSQSFPRDAMVQTLTGFGVPADLAALYHEMNGAITEGRMKKGAADRTARGDTSLEAALRALLGRTAAH